MAKVFTTVPGSVLRIGNFGDASNDTPAIVPDEVAAELEAEMKGEREEEVDDPAHPGKKKRQTVKFAAGPRKDIRVERDERDEPAPKKAQSPKGRE